MDKQYIPQQCVTCSKTYYTPVAEVSAHGTLQLQSPLVQDCSCGSTELVTKEIVSKIPPQHKPFPSIEQYRNVIKLVRGRAAYDGLPLPKLAFVGSVKLHGTNAGIGFTEDGEPFAQGRTNLLVAGESDNYGFAAWLKTYRDKLLSLTDGFIYGEWCGSGIQKGVAISEVPKMFVPFAIRSADYWWTPEEIMDYCSKVELKCVYDFARWDIVIDFSRPEEFQNKLGELTQAVEDQCPAGKFFGVEGVGEGIVWWARPTNEFNVNGLYFKVKGEKHSETKVKTLAPIDMEKVASIRELVETLVTPHRLEKKLEGIDLNIKNTGLYIKTVIGDVQKEEGDTITASGLDQVDVFRGISHAAKQYFMEALANVKD
jgi:hypothetical protein